MPVITLADLEKEFGEVAVRVTNLRPAVQAAGLMGVAEVKDRLKRGVDPTGRPFVPLAHPRPQGGLLPLNNTGLLGASITLQTTANSYIVGTNHPGANLLHKGGTVRPVKAKFLTIPATKEAIYAGTPRNMAGLIPLINRARTGGRLVDAQGVTQWYLTKSVTLPPRPIVGPSVELMARIRRMFFVYLTTGKL